MATFDVQALRSLRHRHGRTYQRKSFIFVEGETGTEFFVILSGAVDIVKHRVGPDGQPGEVVLARLGPGAFFGEMATFTGQRRSATAIAAEPTDVLCFNRETIVQLMRTNPSFAITIIRSLCERVDQMNEWISSAGRA